MRDYITLAGLVFGIILVFAVLIVGVAELSDKVPSKMDECIALFRDTNVNGNYSYKFDPGSNTCEIVRTK